MTDSQGIIKCNCRQLSVISLFQCNSFRLEEHILRHLRASWYSYTEGAAVSLHLITSFIALCGRRKTLHSTWYAYTWQHKASTWGYKELLETKKVPDILPIGKKEGGEKSYDVCRQSYKYVFLQTSRSNGGRGTGNQMSWFQQWKEEEVWNGDWWETVKNTYCISTLKIYK